MTNLDILRSIAVLAVLAAHWALTLSGIGHDDRVAFGVDVYAFGGAGVLAANYLTLAAFVLNFLCGVLAWCLMQTVRPRLPAWLWPVAILGVVTGYEILSSERENSILRNIGLCLVLGAMLPLFKDSSYRPIQIIAHNIARSPYGIYLVHYPTMWVFYRNPGALPATVQHLGFIASLFILPVMRFHLAEQPMIRFGAWLSSHRLLRGAVRADAARSLQTG